MYVTITFIILRTAILHPYHLHGVRKDDAIQANEIMVIQGVHGIHFPYEVIEAVTLLQQISLEALHGHIQLQHNKKYHHVKMSNCIYPKQQIFYSMSFLPLFLKGLAILHVSPLRRIHLPVSHTRLGLCH